MDQLWWTLPSSLTLREVEKRFVVCWNVLLYNCFNPRYCCTPYCSGPCHEFSWLDRVLVICVELNESLLVVRLSMSDYKLCICAEVLLILLMRMCNIDADTSLVIYLQMYTLCEGCDFTTSRSCGSHQYFKNSVNSTV